MDPTLLPGLLAEAATYINLFKLAGVAAVFVIWAYFAQWVDKDTIAVNTYRELWNIVIVSVGIGGLLLALFIPNFLIGLPAMAVLYVGGMLAYVLHRNRLVKPEDTVLSAAHVKRMREQGVFTKKKKKRERVVTERVRLTSADRKVVPIPEEELEREQYALTQDLLFDLLFRRADVADLVPAGEQMKITYEIDGVNIEREPLTRQEGEAALLFLKQIGGLNMEERRKPQRGRITVGIGENKYTVLVESAGTSAGERLRLRVIGLEGKGKIRDLGFTERQIEQLEAAIMHREHGLVLVTAPPKQGLTTTIYSFTRTHDAFLQNIQTLEYESEIALDNVTQRFFTPAPDKTFVSELQRLVRSDPDILIFPEIREREGAALVSQGAAHKIKIYVGMPAEDVFEALRKWVQVVGDKALVAKSLSMISNQRLIRRLCAECKQPYKPEASLLKRLNLPADAVLYRQPEPEYDKHGNPIICPACNGSGYMGRVAVFDLLFFDDELREVLRTATSLTEVQTAAMKKGGLGLQASAIQKVLDGTTSIQEVVRVIRGPRGGAAAPTPKPAAAAGKKPAARPAAKAQPRPQA